MIRKEYKLRIIEPKIDQYLETFGAVCIEGPKWVGKTWTSSFHCKSEIYLGDPEGNFQNRRLAEMNPSLTLEGEQPRLIDEWQEVPQIWDAVRHKVDQSKNKGQFLLTGSATPNHKGILHSGAGRIATLRMRPMSLFEYGASLGQVSLESLCNGKINPLMTGEVDLREIIKLILKGGWPANLNMSTENAILLPNEYLKAVLNDDVYRIDGVKRDISKMQLLLRSLARNESTTASNNTLKNDIKSIDDEDVDASTITNYLDVLSRLFLTDNLRPFSSNIRSSVRVKQSEKRLLSDPSLAAALLKASSQNLLSDLNTLGFLFESLCLRDLKIYAESFDASVFHYQDYNGNEIDAVIELHDGRWCAFEIKLGANQIDEAVANLLRIKKGIENDPKGKPPSVLCVISGLSNAAYQRDDGVFVVPITSLKN